VSDRRPLLAVVALAAFLRLGFVFAYGLEAPPPAWGDDPDYDSIACGLAFDGVYHDSWFPPGYPLFLAAVYRLFGHSLAAVRLIQALLSAATCGVVLSIGRHAFGARIGMVGAVLLALYPGHLYMAWRLMAETVFTLLVALAVLAFQRLTERHGTRAAFACGALVAAAALVKSNLLVLGPLLLAWIALAPRAALPERRPARAAALASGIVLVLLAVPAFDRLAPAAIRLPWPPANAGHTLWWANNPIADGYFVDPDASPAGRAFLARHAEAAELAKAPDPRVSDRAELALAVSWVRENPADFLRLVPRKLWNAFGPAARTEVTERCPAARWAQGLFFGLMLPLALAGMALTAGGRGTAALHLVVGSCIAMTVLAYGTPRFTLPILPYLLLFAAWPLTLLVERARAGWWTRAAVGAEI
jgi:4-amino-4-deoxy-L-arabinose transferase-like glycosyltransferase